MPSYSFISVKLTFVLVSLARMAICMTHAASLTSLARALPDKAKSNLHMARGCLEKPRLGSRALQQLPGENTSKKVLEEYTPAAPRKLSKTKKNTLHPINRVSFQKHVKAGTKEPPIELGSKPSGDSVKPQAAAQSQKLLSPRICYSRESEALTSLLHSRPSKTLNP